MPQKGDRRRGKPLNPDLGYSGDPVHHATSNLPSQRIIRRISVVSLTHDLLDNAATQAPAGLGTAAASSRR